MRAFKNARVSLLITRQLRAKDKIRNFPRRHNTSQFQRFESLFASHKIAAMLVERTNGRAHSSCHYNTIVIDVETRHHECNRRPCRRLHCARRNDVLVARFCAGSRRGGRSLPVWFRESKEDQPVLSTSNRSLRAYALFGASKR